MRQRKLAAKKQSKNQGGMPDVEIAGYTEEIQKMAQGDFGKQDQYKAEAQEYARKGWGVVEEAPQEKTEENKYSHKQKEIKKVVAADNFEIVISAKDQEKIEKRRIDEDKRKIEE